MIHLATRVSQSERLQELAAKVTLVTIGLLVTTLWTLLLNKSIYQERIMFLAVKLSFYFLLEKAVLIKVEEYTPSDLCL